MRDFKTPRTFILSAYRGENAHRDRNANCALSFDLAYAGVPFRACTGSYKGKEEESFVVVGACHQHTVSTLARSYLQESWLTIAENDRTAYLVDTDTFYHTHLGRFTPVGTTKPETDAWTLCDGVYYICDGSPGVDLPEGI